MIEDWSAALPPYRPTVGFLVPKIHCPLMINYRSIISGKRPLKISITVDSWGGQISIASMMFLQHLQACLVTTILITLSLTWQAHSYDPAVAARSSSESGPHYSSSTLSRFLPFSNVSPDTPPWKNAPRVLFKLDGDAQLYNTTMDTGSTGLLVSASDMADYDPETASKYPKGWQYYSSSNKLSSGNWIPKKISFLDANMTATVPVLAVTASVICPWYKASDGSSCPKSPNGTSAVPTSMPTHIRYMGVGFGREYNHQPQGTPDKVSLINIDSIDGKPLKEGCVADGSECLNEGYIISDAGVTVGLTAENTKGFQFVKLALNHSYSDDPRDWTQTAGCISLNGAPCQNSSLLFDTGIARAYLTLPPSVPMEVVEASGKSHSRKLADGQNVTVYFGPEEPYADGYQFIIGDKEGELVPDKVTVTKSDQKQPYINTGRHFYRGFDVLHDPIGGYLGIKKKDTTKRSLLHKDRGQVVAN